MFISLAFDLIAASVRPSFILITPVGVFPFANCLSTAISSLDHRVPEFLVDFAILPPAAKRKFVLNQLYNFLVNYCHFLLY